MANVVEELLGLSHRIGARGDLAILGEGNTSARSGDDTLFVKSSGSMLETLTRSGLTECKLSALLGVLDENELQDDEVDRRLMSARVDPAARKPSVEAYFHAYLLSLEGIKFVAHCHPTVVNAILCSSTAEAFAAYRQCPDEVVCCGGESLLMPYVDPGLRLARELRTSVSAFMQRKGRIPKVILLANHGVICPSGTVAGAWAALAMTVKAAAVFAGATALGGVISLSRPDVNRLDGRPDEDYRRASLGL